jgi:hypothetical protein
VIFLAMLLLSIARKKFRGHGADLFGVYRRLVGHRQR